MIRQPVEIDGLPARTVLIDTRFGVVPYCRACRWGGKPQSRGLARASLRHHAVTRNHRRNVRLQAVER